LGRMTQFLGIQYGLVGEPKQAMAVFERMAREVDQPGSQGFLFNIYKQVGGIVLQMGDVSQADVYLRRGQDLLQVARTSPKPGWRNGYAAKGASWEADIEYLRAMIFETRGQFGDAEKSYTRAEERKRASLAGIMASRNPPPEDQII